MVVGCGSWVLLRFSVVLPCSSLGEDNTEAEEKEGSGAGRGRRCGRRLATGLLPSSRDEREDWKIRDAPNSSGRPSFVWFNFSSTCKNSLRSVLTPSHCSGCWIGVCVCVCVCACTRIYQHIDLTCSTHTAATTDLTVRIATLADPAARYPCHPHPHYPHPHNSES